MAILKIKRLIEDLENNTTQVLASVTKPASTASYAGTSYLATSAANAGTSSISGTATKATSAGYAGTSRVAHFASSGTAALTGTNAIFATGL
jgi:hypothetical protein